MRSRYAVAALLSASAAFAVGQTAKPAAPSVPVRGSIVVSEVTDGEVTVSPDHKTILADIQGIIYSIPSAGGVAKKLTTPVQEASHPNWSAKAGLVAVQSYAGGTFHIWTMHPDGTGLKQLTTGHGDDREPRISPDGRTIAFSSDRAFEGSYDIWTVDIASAL